VTSVRAGRGLGRACNFAWEEYLYGPQPATIAGTATRPIKRAGQARDRDRRRRDTGADESQATHREAAASVTQIELSASTRRSALTSVDAVDLCRPVIL